MATHQRDEARRERDTARGERNSLAADVTAQKAEAAATLRTLQASVLAQQKRIDEVHVAQEKTDATKLATVADLRERLQRAAEDARRGDGDGSAPGAPGAGAGHRAAGGVVAPGLFPNPEAEADDDAYLADRVNEADRSRRARLMLAPE